MRRHLRAILAAAALTAGLSPAAALADPDELMPCDLVLVKAAPALHGNGYTKFICRGAFQLPSPGAAPLGGGELGVSVAPVPPGNSPFEARLDCVGLGFPAGSKGYRCRQPFPYARTPIVLLKSSIVKGIFRDDFPQREYGATHPYTRDLAIRVVTHGTSDSKYYCARFPIGTATKNDATQFKAKDAPAPAACSPSGAFIDTGDALL
jgi:hypothetical protein